MRGRTCTALAVVVWLVALPVGAAPADPAANLAPVPNFDAQCVEVAGRIVSGYCDYGPTGFQVTGPAREAAALAALNAARHGEGLGDLVLPATFATLSPGQRQFVLINLARVARGLPALTALVPALAAIAATGAHADADPLPTGAWTHFASASNWAGDSQAAPAMYGYLYADGWGGTPTATANVDCSGPSAPGCWGHRHAVLGDYGPTGLLGAAAVPATAQATGSSAQFYVAYDGPPLPIEYTWAEALRTGAAGGGPATPQPNPLWPFADLASAPWAAGAAAFLRGVGVVQGTGPGAFSPAAPVQLQELTTFLGRTLSWPQAPALPGAAPWAAAAMGYAAAYGLLPLGVPPSAPCSRLQAVTLVVRALGLPAVAADLPFSDTAGLSAADTAALSTGYADGLIAGVGDGRLDPQGGLTRAQTVVLLQRALLLLARGRGIGLLAAAPQADGRELYSAGTLRMLAPSPLADPTVYWEAGIAPQAVLCTAAGAWWTGRSGWTPKTPPAGVTTYGDAAVALWVAGAEGIGPAVFQPVVRVAVSPGGTQELLPGAASWQPAPAAVGADPARAVADSLP